MTESSSARPANEREELSLNEAATHLLEECRTVVPGMQALFGFQLIAVFNTGFREQLSTSERLLHLALLAVFIVFWFVVPSYMGRSSAGRRGS